MATKSENLHIFFFPFMAHGHMIPIINMAKLFASRGVTSTIVTTPLNATLISKTIPKATPKITLQVLKFPTAEAGLPQGCENFDFITSHDKGWDLAFTFWVATNMLQGPFERLLEECRPDCLVADMFFHWTNDSAAKFGIPRLVFHGTSCFSLCIAECVRLHKPHREVLSDSEAFRVPGLPGDIMLTKKQIPQPDREEDESEFTKLFRVIKEADSKTYGVVVNSFLELEPAYADYYRKNLGRKAWFIGPVSLINSTKRSVDDEETLNGHEYLIEWLNSKKPNSVIYICFGTLVNFSASQLKEIALGLEASDQQFTWVIRNKRTHQGDDQQTQLQEQFNLKMEGKGIVIEGWAPQVMILEHESVGGFVTHCGWNSTMEAIAAGGVPMVTWPVSGEQFYNEKLVREVLGIGVSVGVKEWEMFDDGGGNVVGRESIEKAIRAIMEGKEGEEMRRRAKELKEMSKRAVNEGGSSFDDLNTLIEEMKLIRFRSG